MVNVLFDDCISNKIVSSIGEIIKYHPTEVSIHCLRDYFSEGTKDPLWLSKIDKDWLIITSDRGSHSKKDEKLPLICKQKLITCIIITPKLHDKKQFYKAMAILSCWDKIISLANGPSGNQYRLGLHNMIPRLELKYSI